MASRNGKLEIVRTLLELGVDKEAKDDVRNLMMMMMMMITFSVATIVMIVGDDKGDSR